MSCSSQTYLAEQICESTERYGVGMEVRLIQGFDDSLEMPSKQLPV